MNQPNKKPRVGTLGNQLQKRFKPILPPAPAHVEAVLSLPWTRSRSILVDRWLGYLAAEGWEGGL